MHEERTANIDTHRLTRFSIYEAAGRHVWLLQLFNGVCKSYFLRSTKFFLDISSLKKTYTTSIILLLFLGTVYFSTFNLHGGLYFNLKL